MLKNAVILLLGGATFCYCYIIRQYILVQLLTTYAILLPENTTEKNILLFHIGLYVDIGVDIDSSLEDKKVFTYFDFFSNPR